MLDIFQVSQKSDVPKYARMFQTYTEELGKEDENEDLMVSIFTNFENPGTLFLVAMSNKVPVGFIWAQPVHRFGENYLRISEIYSEKHNIGMLLFGQAVDFAIEGGFDSVKGLVKADKAMAMKRLFKANEEAVFISVELNDG